MLGFSGTAAPRPRRGCRYLGVAVDGQGNVYIADRGNHRVRKVTPGGTITTFAGGGSSLGDGGPATSARLAHPRGVAVDGQGNVYIAEYSDHRVRMVSPAGTISTFAGGLGRLSGDGGPATSARLYSPYGVAVDGRGTSISRSTGTACAQGYEGTPAALNRRSAAYPYSRCSPRRASPSRPSAAGRARSPPPAQ